MNDACLNDGLGPDGLDRLGEPLQAVDAADQDVCDAALLEFGQDLKPELRALGLLDPDPQYLAFTVTVDADREVGVLVGDNAVVTDLDDQSVQEHDRVDLLQWPGLPRLDVLKDGVCDTADEVVTDLDPVDLLQVSLDVTHAQAAGVERDDLLVEPVKAPLALLDDLRLKRPVTVAGPVQGNRAMIGVQRLGCAAVALFPPGSGRGAEPRG